MVLCYPQSPSARREAPAGLTLHQSLFCFQASPGCSQAYFNHSTSVGGCSGIGVARNPPLHVPSINCDLRREAADDRPLRSTPALAGSPGRQELRSCSVLLVPSPGVELESSYRQMSQEVPTAAVSKPKRVQPSNSNCWATAHCFNLRIIYSQ